MIFFERAQRTIDSGQVNHGLLWLVECWRYASKADDSKLQRLARANLSYWRYRCPILKGVLSRPREDRFVTLSPDGRIILTASEDGTVRLWNVATAEPIGRPLSHRCAVTCVAFSRDGRTVVTGSVDGMARLWDAGTGLPLRADGTSKRGRFRNVQRRRQYPPYRMLCGIRRLWYADTARPVGQPIRLSEGRPFVAFGPVGNTIVTVGAEGVARLWDFTTSQPIGEPMDQNPAFTIFGFQLFSPDGKTPIFSPDRKTLVTYSGNTTRRWDAATGKLAGRPLFNRRVLAVSPDSKTLLTCNGKMAWLWDVTNAQSHWRSMEHNGIVSAGAFSPDGKIVLTGGGDKTARLWDAATGLPLGNPLPHEAAVTAVKYCPDGKTLVTVSDDNTARLWEAATVEFIGQPLEDQGQINWASLAVTTGRS